MMTDFIRREDAIKILSERAEILQGEYGDLGGACSGALKNRMTITEIMHMDKLRRLSSVRTAVRI